MVTHRGKGFMALTIVALVLSAAIAKPVPAPAVAPNVGGGTVTMPNGEVWHIDAFQTFVSMTRQNMPPAAFAQWEVDLIEGSQVEAQSYVVAAEGTGTAAILSLTTDNPAPAVWLHIGTGAAPTPGSLYGYSGTLSGLTCKAEPHYQFTCMLAVEGD